jgi:hypothetical protein
MRFDVGAKVQVLSLTFPHTGTVFKNIGGPAGDGRHWVGVTVEYGGKHSWAVYFEAHDLKEEV